MSILNPCHHLTYVGVNHQATLGLYLSLNWATLSGIQIIILSFYLAPLGKLYLHLQQLGCFFFLFYCNCCMRTALLIIPS